jgi:hypothetical protein
MAMGRQISPAMIKDNVKVIGNSGNETACELIELRENLCSGD